MLQSLSESVQCGSFYFFFPPEHNFYETCGILMILETSFPPLMGQKGARGLKITSEELSWMEYTCTSLLSQAENTLGFKPRSHRARSLLREHRTAGKGGEEGARCAGI